MSGKDDLPIYSKTPPGLEDHPMFSGHHSVGIMSGENPLLPPAVPGGNEALKGLLREQNLPFEEVEGNYGTPERSFLIHGPTRDQLYHLGSALGQESVLFSNRGQNELIYTSGPNRGKFHPAHPYVGFHPTEPPPDYWTKIPGKGYLRLYFDENRLLPAPLQPSPLAPATPQDIRKGLAKALRGALEMVGRVR